MGVALRAADQFERYETTGAYPAFFHDTAFFHDYQLVNIRFTYLYSVGMRESPPRKHTSAVVLEDRKATFDRRKEVMKMFSDNAKTYIQLSGAALGLTLTFADKVLCIYPPPRA